MVAGGQRKRAAILISGRGSNMAALIEAALAPDYPASIVGIISDKADAGGLAVAGGHGIPVRAILPADHAGKAAHEAAVAAALAAWEAEIVCLAGYMRILSSAFVAAWSTRLINIHPSLLPAFPGLNTHARALAAGVASHGCTVHFVTEAVDAGPVIAQAHVPVLQGDTEATLAARVLEAEHRLYPQALAMVAAEIAALSR